MRRQAAAVGRRAARRLVGRALAVRHSAKMGRCKRMTTSQIDERWAPAWERVPVDDNALRHSVAEHVLEAVRTGTLTPGSRVHETSLARALSVSLSPVREALFRLTDQGWLEHRPRRGFFVRTISLAESQEIFTFRALLEGFAARMVAERRFTRQERQTQGPGREPGRATRAARGVASAYGADDGVNARSAHETANAQDAGGDVYCADGEVLGSGRRATLERTAFAHMANLIQEGERAGLVGDKLAVGVCNARFHDTLIHLAENALLQRSWALLAPAEWLLIPTWEPAPLSKEEVQDWVDRHQRLLAALEHGSPMDAEREAGAHVRKAGETNVRRRAARAASATRTTIHGPWDQAGQVVAGSD